MPKWLPLGLVACLFCASIFVIEGHTFGDDFIANHQSIHSAQSGTLQSVNVTLNTKEVFTDSSGSLGFIISSDGDGTVVVNITSADGAISPLINANIAFVSGNHNYEVTITPAWGALPGTFSVQVSAWYLNVSNGNSYDPVLSDTVTVTIGLGYTLGVPLILVIIVAVIIIFVETRKHAGSKKSKTGATKSPAEGIPPASGVANKIRCPECKKLIDEGSVFCADCGARVPEFLRYNEPQA